ncbi:MAG: kelch repeat-containing protein [Pirellulaceae bacterium]
MTSWLRATAVTAIYSALVGVWLTTPVAGEDVLPVIANVDDLSRLPANTWTLIGADASGGAKSFARVVHAPEAGRLYLWGFGGDQPVRNRYALYELEQFELPSGGWGEALPSRKADAWAGGKHPPFVIHGRSGPAEGPTFRSVGNQSHNEVTFHDIDGVVRPSPVRIFNQVCYDTRRGRAVFFAGGRTFALDPKTNTFTDLQPARSPTACQQLAWANMGYDPVNDEVVLFGGGDALNLTGGAQTWLYDCEKNTWRRAAGDVEPPLRCTSPIVTDPESGVLVMFGGYTQQAALNDTWVYHCADRRWERREPDPSPPPMFAPAATYIGSGRVLVCEYDATTGQRTQSATRAPKETWIYDVAANTWTPIADTLDLNGYQWLTACGAGVENVALLVAFGPQRRTYALRYDPSAESGKHDPHRPGQVRWRFPDQRERLETAPAPDAKRHKEFLAKLPVNRFVDAAPPAVPDAKTWSTAIATDAGQILYHGGGHSGYSGNDWMHYDVAANRWSMAASPCFPPYLESSNGSPWGYAYNHRPWSQHTYLWYAYDPISKQVVYCARPTIHKGVELALDPDDPDKTFVYDPDEHGYWTWLYDPVKREMTGPHFGRPFPQSWGLALCSTPRGVYACQETQLYRAVVADGKITWTSLGDGGGWPNQADRRQYHYEYLPIIYDARRERLVHLMGRGPGSKSELPSAFEMHVRGLGADDQWQHVETSGVLPQPMREVVYLPKQDALLGLLDQDHVYALDLATDVWRRLDVQLPKGSYGHECSMDYDPVHDVVIATIPSGFSRPVQTLLLRYDPKTATSKKEDAE